MGSATGQAKQIAIALGLYRALRWLDSALHHRLARAQAADRALYSTLLSPHSLVFDVGANTGEKSEALLRAGHRVVAFEPNPVLQAELTARCGRSQEFTLVSAGLSDQPGLAVLYAPPHRPHGMGSFDPAWGEIQGVNGRTQPNATAGLHFVSVTTLDTAIEMFGQPSYIKIDVEGWELKVLEGLSRSVPLVSFEFHSTARHVERTRACLKRLASFGRAEVNITPAERSYFLFDDWVPLDRFDCTSVRLPGEPYGDLFVRRL